MMIDMNIKVDFKIATQNDLDELTNMRIQFLLDLHIEKDQQKIEEARNAIKNYFKEHFDKQDYIGFLGYNDSIPICCAGLLIYNLPPFIGSSKRIQGHVLNFYTISDFRKKGVGTKLMDYVIKKAKEYGVNRLYLNSTKMGEKLYFNSNFKESEDKAMILDI